MREKNMQDKENFSKNINDSSNKIHQNLPCFGILEGCPYNHDCIMTKQKPNAFACPFIQSLIDKIQNIRREPKGCDELPCFSKPCPYNLICNQNLRKCPSDICGEPGQQGYTI